MVSSQMVNCCDLLGEASAGLRDGDKGVELATRACELSNCANHICMAALAAAYAECGDFERAIEYKNRAVKLADDPKAEYEKRLTAYKAKRPCRG